MDSNVSRDGAGSGAEQTAMCSLLAVSMSTNGHARRWLVNVHLLRIIIDCYDLFVYYLLYVSVVMFGKIPCVTLSVI